MTPKQKAAIKHNIKLKWLHGEITQDDFDSMVDQLQHLADIGASLQEANEKLGMYKNAPVAKTEAPAAPATPAAIPATHADYLAINKQLKKKKQAGLITDVEQYNLDYKAHKMFTEGASLTDIEKAVGCDPGTLATDKAIIKLGKEISSVYQDASAEMSGKLTDFALKYGPQMKELEMKFINGTIDQDELKHLKLLTLQKSILGQKMDQLTGVMLNANQKAAAMINGEQLAVFAENANYQSYQITQDAQMDLMFSIYDENTAEKLIKDKPELLPPKVVNGKKDKAWNQKQIAAAYNTFAGECVNPRLRSTFLSILDEEHGIQADIFTDLNDRGWYLPEQADRQKVQQTLTKLTQG